MDGMLNLVNFNVPTALDMGMLLTGGTPMEMHMNEGKLAFQTEPMSSGPGDITGGDRRGMGLNSGLMNDWVHDMLSTVFGTTGETVADAIEATVDVPTQPDDSFMDTAGRALGIIKYNVVDKRLPRFLVGGNFVQKDSQGTPLSERYYELTNYLEAFHDEYNTMLYGRVGEITNPSGPAEMEPTPIRDELLRDQVMAVENFFDHPTRKFVIEELSILRRQEKGARGNPELAMADQARTANFYNDKIQAAYRTTMDEFASFEDEMKATYGEGWSLNSMARAIKTDRLGLPLP